MTSLKDRLSKLEKAPLEDIQELKKKYSPSASNLGNWTRLMLQGKAQAWMEKALYWWQKLNPILARVKEQKGKAEIVKPIRGEGVDVRYAERQPLPDFLIRVLKASLQVEMGDLKGRAEDITPDPDILGRPLKFMLGGERLKLASQVKIEGTVDRVSPARSSDQITVFLQGFPTKNMVLSPSGDFPINLGDGIVNLNLQAVLKKDIVAADLSANLRSTRQSGANCQKTRHPPKGVSPNPPHCGYGNCPSCAVQQFKLTSYGQRTR